MEHLTRCLADRLDLSTLLAAGKERCAPRGTCTLLGPEGPDAGGATLMRLAAQSEPQDPSSMSQRGMREGYRPYFENYTVDASILETRRLRRASQTNDR